MMIQQQALASGLTFADCYHETQNEEPKWEKTEWPPLLGGWRWCHESVVVNDDKRKEVVVVLVLVVLVHTTMIFVERKISEDE